MTQPVKLERNRALQRDAANGDSVSILARRYGISLTRVNEILRRDWIGGEWGSVQKTRVTNALLNANETLKGAKELDDRTLLRIRGIGKASLKYIREVR